MHNICDMALNNAQEYCSNQYASWKMLSKGKLQFRRQPENRSSTSTTKNYDITVEPTVYYSRFMIYLCSAAQARADKQRRKAFDISPRINNTTNFVRATSMWRIKTVAHVCNVIECLFLGIEHYLQLVYGHPRVGWESLKHGNQKL